MKPSKAYLLATAFATWVWQGAVLAQTITVGGTGSAAPIIQRLADAYRKSEPATAITYILPPLGSSGAVRALAAERIDMAVIGRPLSADEQARAGQVTELGRTAFVFASRDGQRAAGFTLTELADVYAGRLTRWDNGAPIRLIVRAETESDTLAMRKMSPAMDAAVTQALAAVGKVVAENDLDAIELIEKTPGSLGPTTLGLVRTEGKAFRLLPVSGVTPSVRALSEGRYPWFKTLFVVVGPQPSPTAQRFLAYLKSAKAKDVLVAADYLPPAE